MNKTIVILVCIFIVSQPIFSMAVPSISPKKKDIKGYTAGQEPSTAAEVITGTIGMMAMIYFGVQLLRDDNKWNDAFGFFLVVATGTFCIGTLIN